MDIEHRAVNQDGELSIEGTGLNSPADSLGGSRSLSGERSAVASCIYPKTSLRSSNGWGCEPNLAMTTSAPEPIDELSSMQAAIRTEVVAVLIPLVTIRATGKYAKFRWPSFTITAVAVSVTHSLGITDVPSLVPPRASFVQPRIACGHAYTPPLELPVGQP